MKRKAPFEPGDISDWFLMVIESAQEGLEALHHQLELMTDEDIIRFALEFREAARYLNGEPHITHLFSQDDEYAHDVACWVVSQGRERYVEVWHHPEAIVKDEDDDLDYVAKHDLNGEAEYVLTERLEQQPWDETYSRPEGDEIVQDLIEKYDDGSYRRLQDFLEAHRGSFLETALDIVKRRRLALASAKTPLAVGEMPLAVRRMYETRRRPIDDATPSDSAL